jgi:hypothetical protein
MGEIFKLMMRRGRVSYPARMYYQYFRKRIEVQQWLVSQYNLFLYLLN